MRYSEIPKFLSDNGLTVTQVVIAKEVDAQLLQDIGEAEFEEICSKLYRESSSYAGEVNIWAAVDEELSSRGLKK